MTHRDFKNYRYNPVYSIVADDKSQLKKKYNLQIIYANKGRLYNMSRAYSEMSKLYYIYQLYKNQTISSKYIGQNHYRRFFEFTDDIPDLDDIFKNYDVILNKQYEAKSDMKNQYCLCHICENYDELLDIIKSIKPEYYESALNSTKKKHIYIGNLFIMKKKDFYKYCEFMYDILFEFDRRHNFTSDNDLLNYSKLFFNDSYSYYYQSRVESFLSERISNFFFDKNFKRIKVFDYGNY